MIVEYAAAASTPRARKSTADPASVWRTPPSKVTRVSPRRVNLQHVTPSLVEPRHDHDRVADANAVQSIAERRMHFEPRVRRAFAALPRRSLPRLHS